MHDCETSWLEGVFARGDRKLCNVLERAYRAGARFDSWEDQLQIKLWNEAMAAEGLDPATYLGTIPVTARLPWDHIDVGLEDGFLAREYRKALKNRLSVPCGKVAGAFVHATNLEDAAKETRRLVCYDCGVACDLDAMRAERLVALRKLGADRPREKALPVVRGDDEEPAPAAMKRAPGPKPGGVRVRFLYTKLGPAAFLSHLDLIRALPRAFRRLGVPLHYTGGFHPKPDMTFGPALSLGIASLGEVVDLKLDVDTDVAALLGPLSDASPAGLRFVGAARLGPEDPPATRLIDTARYAVAIAESTLASLGIAGQAWVEQRLAALFAAHEATIVRRIDGIGKKVDVRAFLRGARIGTPRARDSLARAGIVGAVVPLEVDLAITGGGAVKIAEFVEVLAGPRGADLPFQAVRVALGAFRDGDATSLVDLAALRASAPVPSVGVSALAHV
jgi:radical SAM-linked protein